MSHSGADFITQYFTDSKQRVSQALVKVATRQRFEFLLIENAPQGVDNTLRRSLMCGLPKQNQKEKHIYID